MELLWGLYNRRLYPLPLLYQRKDRSTWCKMTRTTHRTSGKQPHKHRF